MADLLRKIKDELAKVRFAKTDFVFIALLLISFLVFAAKARDAYRFSLWGFGDAQTLLSVNNWNRTGWLKSRMLFAPQGYAEFLPELDSPQLNHHAHGISPAVSPSVGPKLYYTHYPAGYLIPYALLDRFGADFAALKLFSLALSFGAIVLMYAVFRLLAGPGAALPAVLFYIMSPVFGNFSFSLANQPFDDFLKFLFMFCTVMAYRGGDFRKWFLSAWLVGFALSLSSFDSVFFCFIWFCGYDWFKTAKFNLKRYLAYAAAPACAHALQLLQNASYLGFGGAVRDLCEAFLFRSVADPSRASWRALVQPYFLLLKNTVYLVPLAALAAGFAGRFFRNVKLSGRILLILFLAGAAFPLALKSAGSFLYQSRQLMPFMALSFGVLVSVLLEKSSYAKPFAAAKAAWLAVALALVAALGWAVIFTKANRFGLSVAATAQAYGEIAAVKTRYPSVYFTIRSIDYLEYDYVRGYPQAEPFAEYFLNRRLVLSFTEPVLLVKDLKYLLGKGYSFSPVIVTATSADMDEVVQSLVPRADLRLVLENTRRIRGRYVLDLAALDKPD
ncbi:MAG: hypothetical protein WCS77_05525 [Elusimicrobiaceae bacterium]|jgi:hypothetical protein